MMNDISDTSDAVSYQEFLAMFRKQTSTLVNDLQTLDSTVSSIDESALVSIDAKIPGGKFDSEVTME